MQLLLLPYLKWSIIADIAADIMLQIKVLQFLQMLQGHVPFMSISIF